MLSLQKPNIIKQKGKGIEAFSIGHDRWDRPGFRSGCLKLPTNRPILASKPKLLPEQLGGKL